MRILLIFLILNFSVTYANEDQSIQELMKKYDQVMDNKKIEFIDDVFTKKFIHNSGGKEQLISKIKSLPNPKTAKKKISKPKWRKGLKGNMYFVKLKEEEVHRKKKVIHEAELIILKEDGQFKIDGNIGDAN